MLYTVLEINVHHLRGNAIPAGHLQRPLGDSYKIKRWEEVSGPHPRANFTVVALETAEVHQNGQSLHFCCYKSAAKGRIP